MQTAQRLVAASPGYELPAAISFDNVSFSYQRGDQTIQALERVSLQVSPGKFVALVGPSGCGKSTLLHLAAGLHKPSSGSVSLLGQPLQGLANEVGYVFQSDGLLAWKTVKENICLPLRIQRRPEVEVRELVADWLRRTGLAPFAQAYPAQLSGGMRKRVALAQALIHHPKLLLMDEPLSALDVHNRALIGSELLTLWTKQKSTVLFVTHDLEEAIGLADEIVVLSARPAQVKAVYPIDLPRPRNLIDIRLSPEFQRLYAAIWGELRGEVLSSCVSQS
ncbi:MAG: mannosyltransferase [Symbiobacteriaceae bacterium]|jgi:NitT/TauT family transport system ATP-binding protein|nr:mannosyltransferase [Symbiobacteriaceae bacterium]